MLQKFSLFTLNWNCLKASMKGMLSMSPTVPPSCKHTNIDHGSVHHSRVLAQQIILHNKTLTQHHLEEQILNCYNQLRGWESLPISPFDSLCCVVVISPLVENSLSGVSLAAWEVNDMQRALVVRAFWNHTVYRWYSNAVTPTDVAEAL